MGLVHLSQDGGSSVKSAILYERYSPRPNSAECESLEVQHARLIQYCAQSRLRPIVTLRDPDCSARTTMLAERPNGSKLQRILDEGIATEVVVTRTDRIFRDTVDGLTTMDRWSDAGVSLHLADQGGCTITTATATGKMLASVLLTFASFEPALTAERTSRAMRQYQKNGRRVGGKIRYGYMVDPNSPPHPTSGLPTGIMENPGEQEHIACIRELCEQGKSSQVIARFMNEAKSLCRGRKWTAEKVKRIIERKD